MQSPRPPRSSSRASTSTSTSTDGSASSPSRSGMRPLAELQRSRSTTSHRGIGIGLGSPLSSNVPQVRQPLSVRARLASEASLSSSSPTATPGTTTHSTTTANYIRSNSRSPARLNQRPFSPASPASPTSQPQSHSQSHSQSQQSASILNSILRQKSKERPPIDVSSAKPYYNSRSKSVGGVIHRRPYTPTQQSQRSDNDTSSPSHSTNSHSNSHSNNNNSNIRPPIPVSRQPSQRSNRRFSGSSDADPSSKRNSAQSADTVLDSPHSPHDSAPHHHNLPPRSPSQQRGRRRPSEAGLVALDQYGKHVAGGNNSRSRERLAKMPVIEFSDNVNEMFGSKVVDRCGVWEERWWGISVLATATRWVSPKKKGI